MRVIPLIIDPDKVGCYDYRPLDRLDRFRWLHNLDHIEYNGKVISIFPLFLTGKNSAHKLDNLRGSPRIS